MTRSTFKYDINQSAMRKICLWAGIGASLLISSCVNDDVKPAGNNNSVLKIENITFHNIAANKMTGIARFEFYVASDTSATPDTLRFTDTFNVPQVSGYNQTYDFNTPEKAIQMNFDLRFKVEGGEADSVSINSLIYKRNGNTYLNGPVYFAGSFTNFFIPTQTVIF